MSAPVIAPMSAPIGDEALIAAALKASQNAYVPYSKFHVGAAILMSDGRMGTGANIENASYGLSICAETNAITTLIAEAAGTIARVAVVAWPESDPQARVLATPCGRCRQIIAEFAAPTATLIVAYADGTVALEVPTSELLPHPFTLDP
ncbi:MAG: cytidine deaminase [Pseudomonadota bacterium]